MSISIYKDLKTIKNISEIDTNQLELMNNNELNNSLVDLSDLLDKYSKNEILNKINFYPLVKDFIDENLVSTKISEANEVNFNIAITEDVTTKSFKFDFKELKNNISKSGLLFKNIQAKHLKSNKIFNLYIKYNENNDIIDVISNDDIDVFINKYDEFYFFLEHSNKKINSSFDKLYIEKYARDENIKFNDIVTIVMSIDGALKDTLLKAVKIKIQKYILDDLLESITKISSLLKEDVADALSDLESAIDDKCNDDDD